MQLFKDSLQNDFGTSLFGYIPYGGPDVGEIAAIADGVDTSGDDAFFQACMNAADRLAKEAASSAASSHNESAGELLLRAACLYGLAFKPLYGAPVDPRLSEAFSKELDAFTRGIGFLHGGARPHRIPLEQTTLPGYLIPALNRENETLPTVIFTNGYDSNVVDSYFASAVAASRRGYHAFVFDGPGQGEPLIQHGMVMRPDWEVVVSAVLDHITTLPCVDADRIALSGWSLGGYLALRAASDAPRISACIADPGLPSMLASFGKMAVAFGLPADTDPTTLEDAVLQQMMAAIEGNPELRWSIIQRGFWVLGATDLKSFFSRAADYNLSGRLASIQCPTLITAAEQDSLSGFASSLYADLQCPKAFIQFKAIEGAGDHCEMQNRSLLNRRVLDWLDSTFNI